MAVAPVEPTMGVIRIPRPPEGSRAVGETPDGRTIYERTVRRLVNRVPLQIDGKDVWVKDRNGAPVKKQMRNVYKDEVEQFLLHVEVNERGVATGDHSIVEYTPEMEQEIQMHGRRQSATDFRDAFFAEAARRGKTPNEVLDKMFEDAPAPEPRKATEIAYPYMFAPGKWWLSEEHKAAYERGDAKYVKGDKEVALAAAAKGDMPEDEST